MSIARNLWHVSPNSQAVLRRGDRSPSVVMPSRSQNGLGNRGREELIHRVGRETAEGRGELAGEFEHRLGVDSQGLQKAIQGVCHFVVGKICVESRCGISNPGIYGVVYQGLMLETRLAAGEGDRLFSILDFKVALFTKNPAVTRPQSRKPGRERQLFRSSVASYIGMNNEWTAGRAGQV